MTESRDEDNLTILVGGSKTALSIMDINNQTKEDGRLEKHGKPTNTIRHADNTQQYGGLKRSHIVTSQTDIPTWMGEIFQGPTPR